MNKHSVRIAYLLFLVAPEKKKSKEGNKDPQISCYLRKCLIQMINL